MQGLTFSTFFIFIFLCGAGGFKVPQSLMVPFDSWSSYPHKGSLQKLHFECLMFMVGGVSCEVQTMSEAPDPPLHLKASPTPIYKSFSRKYGPYILTCSKEQILASCLIIIFRTANFAREDDCAQVRQWKDRWQQTNIFICFEISMKRSFEKNSQCSWFNTNFSSPGST